MKKIKVTQVKSVIDRPERQKRTMVALGLRKMHASIEVEATPQILGMVPQSESFNCSSGFGLTKKRRFGMTQSFTK